MLLIQKCIRLTVQFEDQGYLIAARKLININTALVKFIVGTDQPIGLVANPHFIAFVKEINNQYKLPCTRRLRDALILEMV